MSRMTRELRARFLCWREDLKVEPIKLTNLIRVNYTASDPQLAAKVLKSLASLYLEKHLALRRDAGEFDFFHQQAEEYRKAWQTTRCNWPPSPRRGSRFPALEKEIAVVAGRVRSHIRRRRPPSGRPASAFARSKNS